MCSTPYKAGQQQLHFSSFFNREITKKEFNLLLNWIYEIYCMFASHDVFMMSLLFLIYDTFSLGHSSKPLQKRTKEKYCVMKSYKENVKVLSHVKVINTIFRGIIFINIWFLFYNTGQSDL